MKELIRPEQEGQAEIGGTEMSQLTRAEHRAWAEGYMSHGVRLEADETIDRGQLKHQLEQWNDWWERPRGGGEGLADPINPPADDGDVEAIARIIEAMPREGSGN